MRQNEVESKLVTVSSGKKLFIDVLDGPSEDAPTLFFMHGLGSSTSFWEAVVRNSALSKTYRIVRHDTDGSGLSPISSISAAKQAGLITIEDYAEDLGAVMNFVGVEKAAGIIGHSMSGLVATHFASRYPHRVEKLVLLGSMRAPMPATQITMLQRASLVNKQGTSAVVETVITSGLSDHSKATNPLSVALVRALVLGTTPGGYASAAHALAGASDPDYSLIKAKTLIVAGEEDLLSNERTTEFLRSSIEGSEVKTIADCGHWPGVENPLKLREHLEEFFLPAQ